MQCKTGQVLSQQPLGYTYLLRAYVHYKEEQSKGITEEALNKLAPE